MKKDENPSFQKRSRKKNIDISSSKKLKKSSSNSPDLSREEKNWGMLCHLAGLTGFIFPFGNLIAPLIVWLMIRESSTFVDMQGKESLNFQISITTYFFLSLLLIFIFIGFILIPVILLIQVICVVIAAMKAQDGQTYRYPLTMRFIT